MQFSDLGLAEPILRALTHEGYTVPTPIQTKAIPLVMEGRDVVGCAQTGTGKTAAFALPILHRLAGEQVPHPNGAAHRKIRCLVLSPTRELALQIEESFRTYGKNLKLRHAVVFGGVGQGAQTQALRAGVDILVATPGRLMDLMKQGFVDLRAVEVFVLDEADRMLDMGFIHDIRRIVPKLPAGRQNLLFSATMPDDIRQLSKTILRDPIAVEVAPVSSTAEKVEQYAYYVDKRNKPILLAHYINSNPVGRMIVFSRTKHGADRIAKQLDRSGIKAEAIHGNKAQNARQRALANFKSDKPPILVATDIAARGIDVDDVTHVVNFDVPNVPESYVHRIGRTARAGASGIAVSFIDREERGWFRDIEKLTRQQITILDDHPSYPAGSGDAHRTPTGNEQYPVAFAHRRPEGQQQQPRPRRDDGQDRKPVSKRPLGGGVRPHGNMNDSAAQNQRAGSNGQRPRQADGGGHAPRSQQSAPRHPLGVNTQRPQQGSSQRGGGNATIGDAPQGMTPFRGRKPTRRPGGGGGRRGR
jgi:ATP-dependent RNA helicase RhlE